MKWFIAEDRSREARKLLDDPTDLLAPEIIGLEVFNALWVAARIGRLPAARLATIAPIIPGVFATLAPIGPLYLPATELARRLAHPVYDCIYLALAAREGGELVTADERMHDAARKAHIKARLL